MANAKHPFDAIGTVVDWIDACKQRRQLHRPIGNGAILATPVRESRAWCVYNWRLDAGRGRRFARLSWLRRTPHEDAFSVHSGRQDPTNGMWTNPTCRM